MFSAEVQVMVSFMRDNSITGQRLRRGSVRRMLSYARPYRLQISVYLVMTVLSAGILTAVPVLLQVIIDHGILRRDTAVVLWTAGTVAGLAVVNALLAVGQRWYSARVGEGLIYDLRTGVFGHVQRQPVAFFTRAKTGSLVRDIGVTTAMYGMALFAGMTLLAALAMAVAYGLGGWLVIRGSFQLGALVALAALLGRLYGPVTVLSNVQADVMTALVSFDRVSFRYPAAGEVSLASLESIALPAPERATRGQDVLHDVSFTAPAGRLTALIGPSGAGKTTITHLVARLYDPGAGTVRIGGTDIRDVTLASLRETVGVVTQDAHLFHDTIRANLGYARPARPTRT
jgi:ABC-type multidrug transport system fused ATPase/permease subunit